MTDGRPSPTHKPTTSAKAGFRNAVHQPFGETTDYMAQERPFCVSINKDGLIAALKRLDDQLRKVSYCYFNSRFIISEAHQAARRTKDTYYRARYRGLLSVTH